VFCVRVRVVVSVLGRMVEVGAACGQAVFRDDISVFADNIRPPLVQLWSRRGGEGKEGRVEREGE
jgi:hypothetical protein